MPALKPGDQYATGPDGKFATSNDSSVELTREQVLELISISALRHYQHCHCHHVGCSDILLAQLLADDDPVHKAYLG